MPAGRISCAEMSRLAGAVFRLAGGGDSLAQTAVAWTVRNRLAREGAGAGRPQISRAWLESWAGAAPRGKTPGFADPGYCRAFAQSCLVWAGEVADPTGGAVDLAHHLAPAPRGRFVATALIGDHVFYRPR